MHVLHCSLCFYSSSSSSFLPLLLSFLPLLFSFVPKLLPSLFFFYFLPKLLPSLFFFSYFPLPSFPSSPHFVFLLCPFFAPFSCFSPLLVFFHLFPSRFPFFLPLFFFSSFLICFSFSSFSSFCLSPLSLSFSLFSFLPITLLFFFFFLRELLVLNAFQDVIEDTVDCNRMQFI